MAIDFEAIPAAPTSQQVQLQELRQMLNDVRETTPEEMRQIRQASNVRPEPMATADAVDGVVQERSYGLLRRWALEEATLWLWRSQFAMVFRWP